MTQTIRSRLGLALPFAASFLLAFGRSPLPAQQPDIDTPYRWIEPKTRFGLGGGYLSTSRGSFDLGPGSTPIVAGRFRTRVSSPLSFEFNATYGASNRFVIDPLAAGGPAIVDTVGASWLLTEVAVQFALTGARTWHHLQPYLTIGGGFQIGLQEPAVPEDLEPFQYRIGTNPGVLLGAGVEWLPRGRIGIGLEFRNHLWRIKAPDGLFDPEVLEIIEETGAPAPQESQWTNNLEFSLSLFYYL